MCAQTLFREGRGSWEGVVEVEVSIRPIHILLQ